MVREQRVTKARNAIFSIRKAPATSGNASVKLAVSLFDSKIEPILTYGSIIWGIESNINSIIINGLKEDSQKSTKEQVLEHLKLILTNPDEKVNLDIVKRMGRKNKENQVRPILVKFKDYHIKEKIIYNGKCDPNSISLKDNSNSNAFSRIQLVQDNFIKFTLNLPRNCSNFISRSEVGMFPLNVKIWTQMVKYFLRLYQGTNNEIIDDTAICAISINSRWVQTITRLLKANGYAYVLHSPKNVDRNKLSDKFLQQCKDNYLQNLYYSGSDRIDSYLSLTEDTDKYQFQTYLDKIRIVEHRTTLTRLRTGCTYLTTDTGRFNNDTPKHQRICPLCNAIGVEDTNQFLFQCRKRQIIE